MQLFLTSALEFEKSAAEVTLPEDPNNWPAEILQEIHKQVPYISDFDPQVIMDRVDGEKGYGFGHVEVGNKTEIQGASAGPDAVEAGVRHVRIPIIIRQCKLQSFDVIVTDQAKMVPLTEKRLRQSLFRPQMFDITARSPGDNSLISTLYPPYRQTYGFGGGGTYMDAGGGGGKMAAAKTAGMQRVLRMAAAHEKPHPLDAKNALYKVMRSEQKFPGGPQAYRALPTTQVLDHRLGEITDAAKAGTPKTGSVLCDILPTIPLEDYQQFVRQITDQTKLAFQSNPSSAPALHVLAGYVEPAAVDPAHKLASSFDPSVVQVTHLDEGGYRVKVASHHAWAPAWRVVDRGALLKAAGEDVVRAADQTGSATMVEDAGPVEDTEADVPELIKDFGIYKVKTLNGKELVGFCFPNLLDTDGNPMPMTLFTNGSETALQGEVYGIRVGTGASLIEGKPRGYGLFYQTLPNGKVQATAPLNIEAVLSNQGEVTLASRTMEGQEVQVLVQPNLQRIVCQDGLHMLVPDTFRWMPLGDSKSTTLASSPDEYTKMAQYTDHYAHVEVRATGESFSVSGGPVEKIAADDRSFLGIDDTLFLLGGLGVHPKLAMRKMGEAVQWQSPAKIKVSRSLKTSQQALTQQRAKTASINTAALRRSLVKEAAVLPDPEAVDTVLSIGFINPENVITFVGYIPQMDEVQSRLCELLVGARLGIRDLPAPAIERTIRGLEETLEGLRTIAFQST